MTVGDNYYSYCYSSLPQPEPEAVPPRHVRITVGGAYLREKLVTFWRTETAAPDCRMDGNPASHPGLLTSARPESPFSGREPGINGMSWCPVGLKNSKSTENPFAKRPFRNLNGKTTGIKETSLGSDQAASGRSRQSRHGLA